MSHFVFPSISPTPTLSITSNLQLITFRFYPLISDGILKLGETPPAYMPNLLPGQFKVRDVNGWECDDFGNPILDKNGRYKYTGKPDGVLNEADMVLLGTTDPGFSMGFGNTSATRDLT